ncbi:MAG: CvpA family protein, partial [Firmicutes bacterium]|nr:CvpA family protein [Bacillota bacterium]
MKLFKEVFLPFMITVIMGGIIFYFALPSLNFKSVGFWVYFIVLLSLFEVLLVIAGKMNTSKTEYKAGVFVKVWGIAIALSILIFIFSAFTSSRLFNSADYANLMKDNIKEAEFSTYQATVSNVPLLDKDSSIQISNRELGSLVDVVSQFELGENEQTTLNGKSVRVSPLYYGSIFKWNNNKNEGTPGYIKIDMKTQEAELVRLDKGIKYSPSEFFGRDLKRYLRMNYPFAIFTSFNFETDENGEPFWIVPVEKHTIGLFGGIDVDYILAVNAVTGVIDKYSVGEIPDWVDNVYNSDLIISQFDDYGSLQNGYWNAVFGQKGVKVTTEGYNYIPQSNDN